MKIYHQAGHNTNWNIESFSGDNTGNGIIFSPVHYLKSKLNKVDEKIRKVSLFDPQYYIPGSQKAKLHSYDFFPAKITDGFSTLDFEAVAHQSARQCLDFQIENSFESITIPTRYFSELATDYIEKQKAFSVEPFLSEISKLGIDKDIFITLPVKIQMIQDEGYRTKLLNWITSYPEISGVYFLNQISENTKQIQQFENLNSHIKFIVDLQQTGLKIIIGYCNTESILLSTIAPYSLTMGAYENTRSFSIDKFLEDGSDRRGPAPRVYFPELLNWLRYDVAIEIKEDFPELWEKVYTPTDYMERVFSGGRPHFTKPELYKHHFILIAEQLEALAGLGILDRIATVESMVKNANELYMEIKNSGIMFSDNNCDNGHLVIWNRILRKIKS